MTLSLAMAKQMTCAGDISPIQASLNTVKTPIGYFALKAYEVVLQVGESAHDWVTGKVVCYDLDGWAKIEGKHILRVFASRPALVGEQTNLFLS